MLRYCNWEVIEPLHLFVYGTLRAGAGTKWSRYLTEASTFIGFGRCRGMLFQLSGYPGMTTTDDAEAWVLGEVYLLPSPLAFQILDSYEGCGADDPPPHEFERHILPVELKAGCALDAWVYLYCLKTEGRKRIVSGDYLGSDFTPK